MGLFFSKIFCPEEKATRSHHTASSSALPNATVFSTSTTHTYATRANMERSLTYVEYLEAKNASRRANCTPPIFQGRGKELVTEEMPWHPGTNRSFGHYRCPCGSQWSSAYSWTDETQACKECGKQVLPHRQEPLHEATDPEMRSPHRQDLCGKCLRLGRLCTLIMETSRNNPNDVVVKGLPMDITKSRLIEIFRAYGSILRINILEPKPDFFHRMAFITFQNPASALQKFNAVDVPTYTSKLRV